MRGRKAAPDLVRGRRAATAHVEGRSSRAWPPTRPQEDLGAVAAEAEIGEHHLFVIAAEKRRRAGASPAARGADRGWRGTPLRGRRSRRGTRGGPPAWARSPGGAPRAPAAQPCTVADAEEAPAVARLIRDPRDGRSARRPRRLRHRAQRSQRNVRIGPSRSEIRDDVRERARTERVVQADGRARPARISAHSATRAAPRLVVAARARPRGEMGVDPGRELVDALPGVALGEQDRHLQVAPGRSSSITSSSFFRRAAPSRSALFTGEDVGDPRGGPAFITWIGVAGLGHQHHDRGVDEAHDVELGLADADGLDQDQVEPEGIEEVHDLSGRAGEPAVTRHASRDSG